MEPNEKPKKYKWSQAKRKTNKIRKKSETVKIKIISKTRKKERKEEKERRK